MAPESKACSWCGVAVGEQDHWRARGTSGEHEAAFCRLEHVVPWVMKGAGWAPIVLAHHRGDHRIEETFDSAERMREWANAGGRYASGE